MLRWLMSWCVPDQALRLRNDLEQSSSDRDAAAGRNLWVALATHGIRSNPADPATRPSA